VPLPPNELTALVLALSFSSGLNVYLTVAVLGILVRVDWLVLPASLHAVSSWYVIAACAALFLVEFVADKIPVFDLVWNALQTFVRIPIAALLAYGATSQLSPGEQALAALVGGAIALAAHSGKIAARAAVSHSPEPFSNIALSAGEDTFVIFLTWFASRHPYLASFTVLAAIFIVLWFVRFVIRSVQTLFRGAEDAVSSTFS
jgi:hypothetical protein